MKRTLLEQVQRAGLLNEDEMKKTGKRTQIYMDARHVDWWERLPRYDRSKILAKALDLYREQEEKKSPVHSPVHSDSPKQE